MHRLAQTQTNHLRPKHWSEGWEKAHLRSREARPLGIPHPPPIIMIISFHINFWLHLKLKESQSLPFNHAKSAILHLLGTYHSTAQSILLHYFLSFFNTYSNFIITSPIRLTLSSSSCSGSGPAAHSSVLLSDRHFRKLLQKGNPESDWINISLF